MGREIGIRSGGIQTEAVLPPALRGGYRLKLRSCHIFATNKSSVSLSMELRADMVAVGRENLSLFLLRVSLPFGR